MKKLSSVFYMWIGLGLSVLAVLMMFVPFASFDGGTTVAARHLFWSEGTEGGAWPAFIGYMLILAGGIALGIIALPFIQISTKVEKAVLFTSGAFILVGAVLSCLITVEYSAMGGTFYGNFDYFLPGFYLTLFFSLGALAMDAIALILDW